MSMSDRKSNKQHCACPAPTLFPTNLVPGAHVSFGQHQSVLALTKRHVGSGTLCCWLKDSLALGTRLFFLWSHGRRTRHLIRVALGTRRTVFFFLNHSFFFLNESRFWRNETRFSIIETSPSFAKCGGLVSCLVSKSRLVLKSTGFPETLNNPIIQYITLHIAPYLQS